MKKTSKTAPAKANSKAQPSAFVGSYTTDLCDVITGSVLSNQHSVILGAPGYGKTRMARAAVARINPDAATNIFLRLDPSTPPEAVAGNYDPIAMLGTKDTPPALVRLTAGTPYAPNVRTILLDEMYRPNDVVFDLLLDTTDRIDLDAIHAPTVIGTSNFVVQTERTQAFIDRIALWCWLNPATFDVAGIVGANLASNNGLTLDYDFPKWDDVMQVRTMLPTPTTVKAIVELTEMLVDEATRANMRPHPRRLAQWSKILFRVGAYYKGSANFSDLPAQATRLLRFAWPAVTAAESAGWQKVANSIVDPIGTAIEVVKAEALKKFKEVAAIQSARDRTARMGEMSGFLASTEEQLKSISADDPRITETIETLTKWFSAATIGVMPE